MSKIFERLEMVEGRKLRLPRVPAEGADLRLEAEEVVEKQALIQADADAVRNLLDALRRMEDERQGDIAEEARLFRTPIRFGNAVILVHCSTGKVLTVTKKRVLEGSQKKVELDATGNHRSIFIIRPAFKTFSDGSIISSGDELTFQLSKPIAGAHYSLYLPAKNMTSRRQELMRSLKLEHAFVAGGDQILACAKSDPCAFHAMLFRSGKHANMQGNYATSTAGEDLTLMGEDVVAFYR